MVSKRFRFEILRCSNDNLPPGVDKCANDTEIDEYISDI